MANPTRNRDFRSRKIAGGILFAIAGLCLAACITIIFMFPDAFNGGTANATTIPQIHYEKVDLQAMLDELDANALRAEEKYQDKYIEIAGEIVSFDSDGKHISIVPYGAPLVTDWTTCYLTDPAHKTFLLEKNVGDVVIIRGKIVSIGEVLGYSVKIAEISD